MDEIDIKILSILQSNARTTATDIAKSVHRSRVTIQNRIAALVKQGEVVAFSAVLKPKALQCIFEIAFKSNGACDQTVPKFRRKYPIINAWSVTGHTDLFILTHADASREVHEMRSFLLQQQDVAQVATHTIIKTYH